MTNWGTIPEWLGIGAATMFFIIGNAVIWQGLRRTSKDNAAGIAAIKLELDDFKSKAVTITILSEYLTRSAENTKAISKLKEEMVTTPVLAIVQSGCRGELMAAIGANSKDTESVKESVKEIKVAIDVQNTQLNSVLVAIGQLGTKIDERTNHSQHGG